MRARRPPSAPRTNRCAVGLAQLLELARKTQFPSLSGRVNWYGILYFLINVPPLLCAWKYMGRRFLLKTAEGILFISALMALLPVPAVPILEETLASALLGGVISGCGIDWDIMKQTARGVTEWRGIGAYTGEPENILVTVINKYEIGIFLDIIHRTDPNAFVIRDDGVAVSGNFEKRL